MPTNADLTANIRAEIARQRLTYAAVADRIRMEPRQFRRRCREEVDWSAVEMIATAHALGRTVEQLAVVRAP